MQTAFLDSLANHGASLISHIALVDGGGGEVGDARKAVSWTTPDDGLIRPTEDLVFDMADGDVVAGWRGFSAATGGTDYGGATLTEVTFSNPGTYTLQAAGTGIDVNAA